LKKYWFIALGGVLGAISRYYIKNIHILPNRGSLPINTFIINITGSFILALLLTAASEILNFDENIKLGIGTGFLGAFTTFSSMCKDAALLIHSGNFITAFSYLFLSAIIGIFTSYLGYITGITVIGVNSKKLSREAMEEIAVSSFEERKVFDELNN